MRIVSPAPPNSPARASAILDAGHDVPLVLTQPDRPAGRGLKLTPSPVKAAALAAGIPVCQPRSLRLDGKYPDEAAEARDALQQAAPALMVVAAYGLLLPQWVLDLPTYGCFNIHASLLPRWRGAAPIQRAIEAGDTETGITIMQMDAGLDTGDMLLVHRLPITIGHTAARLHDELAASGAQAIVDAIAALERGALKASPQPADGVTYAAKLSKAEAALDFSQPANVLARRVRAFNPVPGATLRLPGLAEPVKAWQAVALPATASAASPGSVLNASDEGVDIATADGVLRITELQKAGGKRQLADVFIRGWQP